MDEYEIEFTYDGSARMKRKAQGKDSLEAYSNLLKKIQIAGGDPGKVVVTNCTQTGYSIPQPPPMPMAQQTTADPSAAPPVKKLRRGFSKYEKKLDQALQRLCTSHTWKDDFYNPFSGTRYQSCKTCGKKKEDYELEMKKEDNYSVAVDAAGYVTKGTF